MCVYVYKSTYGYKYVIRLRSCRKWGLRRFSNFSNCLAEWVLIELAPEGWFSWGTISVIWKALFPLLFYLKSIPLPWLIEPFWNVPGRESHLPSQVGNNVFTFSWPFLKRRPFIYVSLSIEINWLTSRSCVSPQTFGNKKLLFWCGKGKDRPRFLYVPRTQAEELFYCYMLLNPKERSGFISSLLLVFPPRGFPDTIPLAFSSHGALSGTPLPCFLTFLSYFCISLSFSPMKFSISCLPLLVSFVFLSFILPIACLTSSDPVASYTGPCPFSQHLVLVKLCFTKVRRPVCPVLPAPGSPARLCSGGHQDRLGGWADSEVRTFHSPSPLPCSLVSWHGCVLLLLLPLGSVPGWCWPAADSTVSPLSFSRRAVMTASCG